MDYGYCPYHLRNYKLKVDENGNVYCPHCGTIFENESIDDDDEPECCKACGNPDYPNCQSSCSIIDE